MPEVSVIMGVFNSAKKVGVAIESILNQTFTDFEFIICDDASTDNTYETIKEYAGKDKRIKLLKNEKNLGLAKTLNICLESARGKYIARMDDDDFSHPQRFEKQIKFLDENPEYAIVGTSKNYFDENGIWGKAIHSGERTLIDIYCGRNFTHPSVMMRREALESVGFYTDSPFTLRCEDYDLWCKLYYKGYKGFNMSEILLDYCESKESIKRRKFKYRVNGFKLRLYWRKKFALPKYYDFYAYKELIAGIIPKRVLLYRRKKLVNKIC